MMKWQPCLLCFGAILLRCEGGVHGGWRTCMYTGWTVAAPHTSVLRCHDSVPAVHTAQLHKCCDPAAHEAGWARWVADRSVALLPI